MNYKNKIIIKFIAVIILLLGFYALIFIIPSWRDIRVPVTIIAFGLLLFDYRNPWYTNGLGLLSAIILAILLELFSPWIEYIVNLIFFDVFRNYLY